MTVDEALIDPEAPIDPNLSLPERAAQAVWPAPLVTNMDPWPADVELPAVVAKFQTWAEKRGYRVTVAYSMGSKPGRAKETWLPVETIGAWCVKQDAMFVVLFWERTPESPNPAWKAIPASFRDGRNARAAGHLVARRVMDGAPWPV